MSNIQLNRQATTYIFDFFLIVELSIPTKYTKNDDVDLPPQFIKIFCQNISKFIKIYSSLISV